MKRRRILSLALSAIIIGTSPAFCPLLISYRPAAFTASAADEEEPLSYSIGIDGIFVAIYSDHVEIVGYNTDPEKYADDEYDRVIWENIEIPEEFEGKPITKITRGAFYQCTALKTVSIPSTVKVIDEAAFYKCSSLEKVTIAKGVETIGYLAFSDCTNLSTVNIPNSVKSIGEQSFTLCEKLTSIKIPDSVTAIGPAAFS